VQASLFDLVAQGPLAIRGGGLAVPNGFQAGQGGRARTAQRISVRLVDFVKSLDGRGNTPRSDAPQKDQANVSVTAAGLGAVHKIGAIVAIFISAVGAFKLGALAQVRFLGQVKAFGALICDHGMGEL
jgi:hypothetical protein